MSKELEQYYIDQELQDQLEHQNVLLALGVILKQKEGLQLFSYLFKNLDVACVPPQEMEGKDLHEYLGHLRAGNSIYKLACEADYSIAATITAQIERQKYDNKLTEYRIVNSTGNDID